MKNLVCKQSGVTLIEVAIAAGILAFMSLGLFQLGFKYAKDLQNTRYVFARSEVATRIRANARNLSSYINSQTLQPALSPCLSFSSSGPNCISRNADGSYVRTPLVLLAQNDASEVVAGTEAQTGDLSPVYYDRDGRLCTAPDASAVECPLQAVVSYTAHCANGVNECHGAEALQLSYQVKLRGDFPFRNDVILRPATGVIVTEIGGAPDFRFLNASTLGTPEFTDFEMIKGDAIALDGTAPVFLSIRLFHNEPIDSIEVRSYTFPNGCTFSSLDVPSCARPSLEAYTLHQTLPIVPGSTQNGIYPTSVSISASGFGEVVALAKHNGNTVLRSSTILRMRKPSVPSAVITGPSTARMDCSLPGPSFDFQAQDQIGLKEARAWITPALPGYPDGSLPGFAFNVNSIATQPYTLPYSEMVPGATYTLNFSVTNFDNISAQATWTFDVDQAETESVIFDTPLAGAFIRSTGSLSVETTVHLNCGKTISSSHLAVSQGATTRMPAAAMSCGPTVSSKPGLVAYKCSGSFACSSWLGQFDCLDPEIPDGTLFTLQNVVNPSSGTPLSTSEDVVVGPKILASFNARDTVYFIEKEYLKTSSVPFQIRFSAVLSFPALLSLRYSTGESINFTCSSGSSTCTVTGPVPASDAVVTLARQPDADPAIVIGTPATASIFYDSWILDCRTQSHQVVCPASTTRKILIKEVVANDFAYETADDLGKYMNLYTNGNLDFLYTARLVDPADGTGRVGLVITQKHYDENGNRVATTETVPVYSQVGTETRIMKVMDDLWQVAYDPSYLNRTEVKVRLTKYDGEVDVFLMRQCYCE